MHRAHSTLQSVAVAVAVVAAVIMLCLSRGALGDEAYMIRGQNDAVSSPPKSTSSPPPRVSTTANPSSPQRVSTPANPSSSPQRVSTPANPSSPPARTATTTTPSVTSPARAGICSYCQSNGASRLSCLLPGESTCVVPMYNFASVKACKSYAPDFLGTGCPPSLKVGGATFNKAGRYTCDALQKTSVAVTCAGVTG